MKSPWTKKNPLLSMYMSGANAMAGALRSHATAIARRQASAVMAESVRQATGFWSGVFNAPSPKKRHRKSR